MLALKTMENRACDLGGVVTGIDEVSVKADRAGSDRIFDLGGREVKSGSKRPAPGLYVAAGRKVVVRP